MSIQEGGKTQECYLQMFANFYHYENIWQPLLGSLFLPHNSVNNEQCLSNKDRSPVYILCRNRSPLELSLILALIAVIYLSFPCKRKPSKVKGTLKTGQAEGLSCKRRPCMVQKGSIYFLLFKYSS